MRSSVQTFILDGVEAIPCRVEVAILDEKTPRTTVVGLPDAAVREAVDRVQAAMEAGGFGYPPGRITINLSPATHRKEGPLYDLPIAVAVLLASGELGVDARARVRDCVIAGELRLDGTLQAIPGAVAMADLAARSGIGNVLLPSASADAAALVDRIRSRPAHCLGEAEELCIDDFCWREVLQIDRFHLVERVNWSHEGATHREGQSRRSVKIVGLQHRDVFPDPDHKHITITLTSNTRVQGQGKGWQAKTHHLTEWRSFST